MGITTAIQHQLIQGLHEWFSGSCRCDPHPVTFANLSGVVNQDLGKFMDTSISQGYLQNLSICENLSNYITRFQVALIGNRIVR